MSLIAGALPIVRRAIILPAVGEDPAQRQQRLIGIIIPLLSATCWKILI